MIKVLLTGANGQLGKCFQDVSPIEFELLAKNSSELDITDEQQVEHIIKAFAPDFIVNAAAFTAVDKAEEEKERAFDINAKGVLYLAKCAEEVGATLIHISTDYVFDGKSLTSYIETDIPNPVSIYGMSKLAGEYLAFTNCSNVIVLRTAWVFSEYGHNFLKTMLRLAENREEISVVSDQYGNPTYAGDVAKVVVQLILRKKQGRVLYHCAGNAQMSWCDFAKQIFRQAGTFSNKYSRVLVKGISSQDYPTPVKRPENSRLDCSRLKTELSLGDSSLDEALSHVLSKLI